MATIEELHRDEVSRGRRFEFGKNWARFLRNLTPARIALAEKSLQSSLKLDRLDGMSFLDVGSGSGLFSLVARRLGAVVRSFDYDTQSVACTRELKRRYFPDDADWIVEQGSVLDTAYLGSLGTFDIVYSWGVLHHTGQMQEALANVKPLVKVGGRLFIAIYNDQGEPTDEWARIKGVYNGLPRPLALAYALTIIGREEMTALRQQVRSGAVGDWVRTWTEYAALSTRGMSRWHDWIDWIGGYPYERARVEQIVDVYAPDGFKLDHLVDRSTGYGCNEFVFRRLAAAGIYVESRLLGGNSMARRYGFRVQPPLIRNEDGLFGRVDLPVLPLGSTPFLMRGDRILGQAQITSGVVRLNGLADKSAALELSVVPAVGHPLSPPFHHARGRMWQGDGSALAAISDNGDHPRRSPCFLFEDDVQLPLPHATHDEIDRYGAGRFSHWESTLYFSSLDGSDPNTNGKTYRLLAATDVTR